MDRRHDGGGVDRLARRDEIIPPRHSQRLFDALPEPKRRWLFPGAGHNSWPVNPLAPWWDEVLNWLDGQRPVLSLPGQEERAAGEPD